MALASLARYFLVPEACESNALIAFQLLTLPFDLDRKTSRACDLRAFSVKQGFALSYAIELILFYRRSSILYGRMCVHYFSNPALP